jgi:hypothetical protein
MKDSKFIELLNLYVDHQISPADAALLEAEVRDHPERRRVYREYCQMQKACSALAENFRSEAPATNPKVVEFKPRRSARVPAYLAGLAVAAACVALVLGVRSRFGESPAAPAADAHAAVAAAPAPVLAARPALQPVFGPRLLATNPDPAELASADQAAFGEWMNSIQLSSLPDNRVDDLRFESNAALPTSTRTFRNGRTFQGKVEWTAFTFQK